MLSRKLKHLDEGLETRQLLYLLKNNGEMCKSAKCGCF